MAGDPAVDIWRDVLNPRQNATGAAQSAAQPKPAPVGTPTPERPTAQNGDTMSADYRKGYEAAEVHCARQVANARAATEKARSTALQEAADEMASLRAVGSASPHHNAQAEAWLRERADRMALEST